jgi:predicted N-acetyltransferase YhbS
VLMTSERRGSGLGSEFVRHVMREREAEFYLCAHDPRIPFYERLGFERVEESEIPEHVRDYAYRSNDLPSRRDHVHHLMRR